MSGYLEGGWGFILAAYGIVYLTVATYGFSLARKYFSRPDTAPNIDQNEG